MDDHVPSLHLSRTCSGCSKKRTQPMTCVQLSDPSHSYTRSCQSSRPYGSYMTQVVAVLALVFLVSPAFATMDIWSFEYQRKFGEQLALGQCPMREVVHQLGNKTVAAKINCDLSYPGSVRHVNKRHKNVRNIIITKPEDITAYLGLCGGDAASFLGILNSGDCVGLDIASKLSFGPRTLVRAYVSYFSKSVDVLDKGRDVPISIRRLRERESGLEDKYYLHSVTYGTQEIIFVQFRFMNTREAKKARGIRLESSKMTEYMKRIRTSVGTPKIVTVISMSTSDPDSYKIERFETLRSTPEAWNRTYRHVDIQERIMDYTNERIETGTISPHLKYQFSPFLEEQTARFRVNNPKDWEQISMIEVRLRRDIALAKKNSKKCRTITRGRFKALCKRVRHHRKMLVTLKKELHKQRAQWGQLTLSEKQNVMNSYRIRVASNSRFTRKLAKEVFTMQLHIYGYRKGIKGVDIDDEDDEFYIFGANYASRNETRVVDGEIQEEKPDPARLQQSSTTTTPQASVKQERQQKRSSAETEGQTQEEQTQEEKHDDDEEEKQQQQQQHVQSTVPKETPTPENEAKEKPS
ncbi:hypothetical protein ElyMa_005295600 [Elysia marginata]|uniref:Uncharacterized protein n=1 Tax=Elysia marginata TaxID=1093978 RepID=A0AAV4K285_9GAST|nr:hypothetical protein ElyMa_005295600 [Elysia marginata]